MKVKLFIWQETSMIKQTSVRKKDSNVKRKKISKTTSVFESQTYKNNSILEPWQKL